MKKQKRILAIREALCLHLSIAEELVPVHNLRVFYKSHEVHALLPLRYPTAKVVKDSVPLYLVDAYRKTFRGEKLPDNGFATLRVPGGGSYARALEVARSSKYIAVPLSSADACLQAAYAMLKCEELYATQCWYGSQLTSVQRAWVQKYPLVDFQFWVKYGSWSLCSHCGSYFFNDKYFSENVYRNQVTAVTPDLMAPYRKLVPSDPIQHAHGAVGVSSRWWYLPGMYRPTHYCGRCTRPPPEDASVSSGGAFLTAMLRKRREKYLAGQKRTQVSVEEPQAVEKTGQLYRVPRVSVNGIECSWSVECVTWPRYADGEFSFRMTGESMLDMTVDEVRSLSIIVLRTDLRQERYFRSSIMEG